jgi:hypothetical protein
VIAVGLAVLSPPSEDVSAAGAGLRSAELELLPASTWTCNGFVPVT